MVYHCAYGLCKSDSRYTDRPHMKNVTWYPFPKPHKEKEKCHRWVHACGRENFTIDMVTKCTMMCSRHFVGGRGPTLEHPDPIPAHYTASQIDRFSSPPRRKRKASTEVAPLTPSKQLKQNQADRDNSSPVKKKANTDFVEMDNGMPLNPGARTVQDKSVQIKFLKFLISSSSQTDQKPVQTKSVHSNTTFKMPVLSSSSTQSEQETQVSARFIQDKSSQTNPGDWRRVSISSATQTGDEETNVQPTTLVSKAVRMDSVYGTRPSSSTACSPSTRTIIQEKVHQTQRNSSDPQRPLDSPILFDITKFIGDKKKFLFYTGVSPAQFEAIWSFLEGEANTLRLWGYSEGAKFDLLSLRNQLFLTLIRLRRAFEVEHIGTLFNLSSSSVSRIFITWIQFMYHKFKTLDMFPSREHIALYMMPPSMKKYNNLRCIIDCTEIFCETSSNFQQQGNKYSNYKNHATHKVLVAVAPNGTFTFISDCFEGSISDIQIVKDSGFLEFLQPNDAVMADRGFPIQHILAQKRVKLIIPPFLGGRKKFTEAEELLTRRIAKDRIHVERAIGRLKNFRILKHQVCSSLDSMISQIVFVVACIVNFHDVLVT